MNNTGITVADVPDIFNLPPYGCARRCYFRKTEEPEIDPLSINDEHHKKDIVQIYSDFVANIYRDATKRRVRSMNKPFFVNSKYPYILGDCDQYITKYLHHSTDKYVPLEIRVLNRAEFYAIRRDGLPGNYYNYQLHHQMIAKDSRWASLAAFCPDVMSMLTFDFTYDEVVAAEVITEEREFWLAVNDRAIDRLATPSGNLRCHLCGFRNKCIAGAQDMYSPAKKEKFELLEEVIKIKEYRAGEKRDVEAIR
ncbi:MAG: hypothetical protein LLG40_13925 [Deltaproteobacteria bacterium]|nr:hypothetical protein [Deltaproteobacteria bacterium]